MFLPITTTFRVCDIWRSFWVQRILWDIGGNVVFLAPNVKQKRNAHSYLRDMEEEQQIYHESAKFVRFLSAWKSPRTSLFENIRFLAHDIAKNGFWKEEEVQYLNIWLNDLIRVGYQPPSSKFPSNSQRKQEMKRRRAAVCVTGRLTSPNDEWLSTESQIRRKFHGQVDLFYSLSSSGPVKPCEYPKVTFFQNATIKIFQSERKLYSQYSKLSCQKNLSFADDYHLWIQAECYDLVISYEKENNVKYNLLVYINYNSFPDKMPLSFERKLPFDVNQTILLSRDKRTREISDAFVVGPMEKMSYFMRRWHLLNKCLLTSMDLEEQLNSISQIRKLIRLDNETITDRNTAMTC